MVKLQQLLLTVGSMITFVLALLVAYQNWATPVDLAFLQWQFPAFSLGVALVVVGILLSVSISMQMASLAALLNSRQRKAERELERKEVDREGAAERVKVLEAKVDTLEKALSEALRARP